MPSDTRRNRWPAVRYESVDWSPTVPVDLLTRAQRERYRGPYSAAVVPTIAKRSPSLPDDVATLASEATLTLTRFDAELGHDIAPFASILLRSESAASSQIENLSSGAKQIALAELGSRDKRNASAIVANVAAMSAAVDLADHLDSAAILSMHRALMESQDPTIAGRWRTDQVWIGGSSIGPHDADFAAPAAAKVPGLIDDLISFTHRTDLTSADRHGHSSRAVRDHPSLPRRQWANRARPTAVDAAAPWRHPQRHDPRICRIAVGHCQLLLIARRLPQRRCIADRRKDLPRSDSRSGKRKRVSDRPASDSGWLGYPTPRPTWVRGPTTPRRSAASSRHRQQRGRRTTRNLR